MTRKKTKIRIRIENESTLSTLTDSSLSRWKIAFFFFIFIILSIAAGSLIVYITPLRTLLPGYLKENQRSATEDNLMRLDSLRAVYETNQRFIDNYLRVTDISRIPTDSVALKPDSVVPISDSLMLPSERERHFVARMEEHERFNISVLAPLAADGMDFSNVSEAGIFTSASKDSQIGEVIVPMDEEVLSVADGTVIAVYYSRNENGYVIIIQHPRGFISRYSRLGSPLTVMGETVEPGQIIASAPFPDRFGKRIVDIRMWHNGLPVIPYRYLHGNEIAYDNELFGRENSFESPRGK